MKKFTIPTLLFLTISTGLLGGLQSCKKFADPPMLIEDYTPDTTTRKTISDRKILIINIDGLKSDALTTLKPTVIQSMLSKSKYAFNTLVTLPTNNTASWGSMLTGNFDTRLWDSTFYAVPVDSTNTIPVPLNITVLKHIHDNSMKTRIVAISPWPNLVNTLMADADKKVVSADDAATKASILNTLKTDTADLIISHFTGVQQAGKVVGYDATKPEYQQAIQTVDGHIGEILAAIKSKPNAENEKWLTILTTSQVSDTLLTIKNYQKSPIAIPNFIIAHYGGFTSQDLTKMNPTVVTKNEDVTALVLFWLKVPRPSGIINSQSWLDRFEIEFLTR